VLGIDFGGTKIALGIASLDGALSTVRRVPTEPERGAAAAVDRALLTARELLDETPGELLAVGAVSPGVVGDGSIALAPNVPGWGDLALGKAIHDGLGVAPAAVANDVKAATLAELRWGALRNADPALLLSLGTGVAVGIAIGGRVVTGAHGAAGEVGYFETLARDGAAADGRRQLEQRVGGRALAERGGALNGGSVTAADMFRAGADPALGALVDEALAELAVHVAHVATLMDPQRIAVGGGLMGSADRVLAALRERLDAAVPYPPELVAARFVDDGPLRGAIALALEEVNRRRDAR
jgi:glucokinase